MLTSPVDDNITNCNCRIAQSTARKSRIHAKPICLGIENKLTRLSMNIDLRYEICESWTEKDRMTGGRQKTSCLSFRGFAWWLVTRSSGLTGCPAIQPRSAQHWQLGPAQDILTFHSGRNYFAHHFLTSSRKTTTQSERVGWTQYFDLFTLTHNFAHYEACILGQRANVVVTTAPIKLENLKISTIYFGLSTLCQKQICNENTKPRSARKCKSSRNFQGACLMNSKGTHSLFVLKYSWSICQINLKFNLDKWH